MTVKPEEFPGRAQLQEFAASRHLPVGVSEVKWLLNGLVVLVPESPDRADRLLLEVAAGRRRAMYEWRIRPQQRDQRPQANFSFPILPTLPNSGAIVQHIDYIDTCTPSGDLSPLQSTDDAGFVFGRDSAGVQRKGALT